MSDLEQRIQKLEDESAIRKLKAVYLNACDQKDVEAIKDCFTEDAELIYPPIGAFGVDGLVEVFTQMAVQTSIVDVHQAHNGVIEIDGDTASAQWNLSFATYNPDDKSFRLLSSFYKDKYVRTDRGWKICFSESCPRTVVDGTLADATVKAEWQDMG
ncbi:MAG: nuclear transport factor 2 family protein [Parvibaculales bacterium]